MATDMKKCPHCAEEIRVEAIKCRYCREQVPAGPGGSAEPDERAPTKNRVAVWVLLGFVAVLGLYIVGQLNREYWPGGSSSQQPSNAAAPTQWTEVVKWSGSGIKETESFNISSGEWRVNWETKNEAFAGASIFQIMVYKSDGTLVTLAANKQGVGKDVSYVRGAPGRYYLMINSGNVNWTVSVEDQRQKGPS